MSFLGPSQRFDTRGQLFGNQILSGRGGGVALIVNSNVAADVGFSDCVFRENTAAEYGGGMYVLLQGPTSHTLAVNSSR